MTTFIKLVMSCVAWQARVKDRAAARLSCIVWAMLLCGLLSWAPNICFAQYTWTAAANRTWDVTSANWTTGAGNIAWVDNNAAVLPTTGTGTINVAGTQTVTGLTASGAYTLTGGTIAMSGASSTLTIQSDTTTIGSVVAGSVGLRKAGAGTLILTAANTYSGTTTINAGTLQVGNGGSSGSLGTGAIVNNGYLVYNLGAANMAFGSSGISGITGSGSISMTGGQQISFGGGNTTIDTTGPQVWRATASTGFGNGFSLATTATVALKSSSDIAMTGILGTNGSDSGVLSIDTSGGNGNVNLNVALGVSGINWSLARLNVTAGTGTIALSNTTGLSWGSSSSAYLRSLALSGGDVNVSANVPYFGTITVTNSGTSSTFSGNIGTTGSTGTVFTKAGSGVLILTGSNTFAGNTLISQGTLQVGNGGSSGSLGTGAIVNNGYLVYNLGAANMAFGSSGISGITGSGSISMTGGQQISFGGGNTTIDTTGPQVWRATASTGFGNGFSLATTATVALKSSSDIAMTGILGTNGSDSGVLSIDTSGGNGNVNLNVALGVSGINWSLARLNVTAGTGTVTLSNTTGLSWGTGTFLRSLSLSGGDVNVSANMPAFGTITVTNSGTSSTFSGNIGTTGSTGTVFTKAGSGVLILTGSNTFAGNTLISQGTLQVGNGGSSGSLGTGAIVNNGYLVYNLGAVDFSLGSSITGSGSMSITGGQKIIFSSGSSAFNTTGPQIWRATGTTAASGFTLQNSSTVTLTSQSNISMAGILGTGGSNLATLNIDTSGGNGNIDLNVAIGPVGYNFTLGRLALTSGTGAITISNTTGLSWATGYFPVLALTGGDVNVSANIPAFGTITVTNSGSNSTFSGNIGTTGSTGTVFTKAGSGVLTLTGTNTYAGATAISGGILRVGSSGRLSNTSGITINGVGAELNYNSSAALTSPITFTQGTLSGTGTIGTAVTAGANDILSPGNSPGAQSFTSGLTWDPAGTYLWEMNNATSTSGTGWDIINVSGGSGLTINATSGTTFKIAITSLTGTAAGNAANFSATTSGSWTILSSSSISGFAANKFNLDRSAFTNTSSGSFTISQVASGANQTLVLAYNTISALSSSTSSVTGFRVMQGESTTTAVNLLNAGPDATGYSLSPSGGLSLVSSSAGTLAGSGTQAITFGYASTGTTGARTGTVSFTNTGNSGDANGSVSVSGAVVTNRAVTASAVDFGLVHLGASGTATSTFTSTGSDNDFTRITVGNGTGGGLTVSGSSGFVFNGSGGSSRTVTGIFATAGALSGTISLTNASAEAGGTLPGQVPGTTGLAYSASVFSGTATWNVAGGGSWGSGASGSWTSTGGVQAAPGTFAGYANTDRAIFSGTQAGTSAVLLNGAAPSLAAISFTNTANRYVIDQGSGGSLTLAASSGKPTIDVVAGGLHEIKMAILGSGGLSKIGAGTLVLSGSSGFTGGTDVAAGTLAINGSLGGAVNVASGAILGGTGALNGLVNVAGGGILAPGNSPGTLTMNAGLVLADASVLSFELSATDFTPGGAFNDLINVNGSFTLDGIVNVTGLGDFSTVANNTKWRLFNYDTGSTFTNNGLSLGAMPSVGASGKYFQIDTATAGQVNLVIVPEPGAVVMVYLGIASGCVAAIQRRWRRTRGS